MTRSLILLTVTVMTSVASSVWAQPSDYNGRNYRVVDRDGSRVYEHQNLLQQGWNALSGRPMYEDRRTNTGYSGSSSSGSYSGGSSVVIINRTVKPTAAYTTKDLLYWPYYMASRAWTFPASKYIKDGLDAENVLGYFTAEELKKDKDFKLKDVLAGISPQVFYALGWSLKEIKDAGADMSVFTVSPVDSIKIKISAVGRISGAPPKCTVSRSEVSYDRSYIYNSRKKDTMIEGSFSLALRALMNQDPQCSLLITEKDLIDIGLTPKEVLAQKGTVTALRKLGFTTTQMLASGVSAADLKASDPSVFLDDATLESHSIADLRAKGYSLSEILDCKVDVLTLQILKDLNVNPTEILATQKVKPQNLLDAGYDPDEVLHAVAPVQAELWSLLGAAQSGADLTFSMSHIVRMLKSQGISVTEVRAQSLVPVRELKAAGYTDLEIAQGLAPLSVETITELYASHISIETLKAAGASLDLLVESQISWDYLFPYFRKEYSSQTGTLSLGSFVEKYKIPGIDLLHYGLYPAPDLYRAKHISDGDVLKQFNSQGYDLYRTGFTMSEILGFKLSLETLKSQFATHQSVPVLVKELKSLNVDLTDLLAYFENEELVLGGYSLNEVRATRMKQAMKNRNRSQ